MIFKHFQKVSNNTILIIICAYSCSIGYSFNPSFFLFSWFDDSSSQKSKKVFDTPDSGYYWWLQCHNISFSQLFPFWVKFSIHCQVNFPIYQLSFSTLFSFTGISWLHFGVNIMYLYLMKSDWKYIWFIAVLVSVWHNFEAFLL